MSGLALHVEGLSVRFGEHRVLEEVSLCAERHAITALMGPSGCGKTSFLLCINRLCDHASGCTVTGRVRVEGEDVLAPGTDLLRLRRKVGMIFRDRRRFRFRFAVIWNCRCANTACAAAPRWMRQWKPRYGMSACGTR